MQHNQSFPSIFPVDYYSKPKLFCSSIDGDGIPVLLQMSFGIFNVTED